MVKELELKGADFIYQIKNIGAIDSTHHDLSAITHLMIYGTLSGFPCMVQISLTTQNALAHKQLLIDNKWSDYIMELNEMKTNCQFSNGCWFLNIH